MTSELIAEMPTIRPAKEFPEQLQEVLRIGRDCKVTGDILALLILGPNNLIEEKEEVKSYLFGLFKRKRVVVIDKQKELAKKLLTEVEPKELFELGARLFERIQAPYFFALTTSLSDVNILRPTKEVD